jgi:neutral trehalase
MDVAKGAPKSKRDDLYHDIATAAESGWDFSSRWMRFASWFLPTKRLHTPMTTMVNLLSFGTPEINRTLVHCSLPPLFRQI